MDAKLAKLRERVEMFVFKTVCWFNIVDILKRKKEKKKKKVTVSQIT